MAQPYGRVHIFLVCKASRKRQKPMFIRHRPTPMSVTCFVMPVVSPTTHFPLEYVWIVFATALLVVLDIVHTGNAAQFTNLLLTYTSRMLFLNGSNVSRFITSDEIVAAATATFPATVKGSNALGFLGSDDVTVRSSIRHSDRTKFNTTE